MKDVLARAGQYMPPDNIALLKKSYDYAVELYKDNPRRMSGKPYITHPLAVAHILAAMQLDVHTVIAGLLHKALRGMPPKSSDAELAKLFGVDVATIVRGTTKINDIQFKSKLDYKAENVKKMLLAISVDIRVLLVKLADHLHDMQTLEYVPPARQRELAQDTMDLYAPMASRLGIDRIKRELEDAAFRYLYPEKFNELNSKMEMSLTERENFVEEIKSILQEKIKAAGIPVFQVLGRPKHLYSIYRKLVAQNISLDKVYDKVAFRVIVREISECYEVMGVVHSLWQPIASRFKDFISSPKANLYQSLHTSVIGPHGDFMEIQIRTEKMDEIANDGIAAHWAYKEGADISRRDATFFHWLKQLVHSLQEVEDAREFLDTVRAELDYSEVYALTPNGEVKELPTGSTPLDFAYSIHTEVGNHCIGAKIDGRIVPLRYKIQHGDVIEIITSPSQHPNQGWMNMVRTSRAKSRIRHWLKQEEQTLYLESGREICERELKKHNLSIKRLIKTGHLKNILKQLNCNTLNDLLCKVGAGKIKAPFLAGVLRPPELGGGQELEKMPPLAESARPAVRKHRQGKGGLVQVDGIDDMLVKISNCCMPMPGDDIAGFVTAGRGVSVHKAECRNLLASDPERRVAVQWVREEAGTHRSRIQVTASDSKGLLVRLCNLVNGDDADILDVEAHSSKKTGLAGINLVVSVRDREHLNSIIGKIRQLDGVLEARRG
jgi:GTP pyrophosphokinase